MCDPGVHTLLSGYSPQGSLELIAHNANQVVDKHLRRIGKRVRVSKDLHIAYGDAKQDDPHMSRTERRKWRNRLSQARHKAVKARRKKEHCVRNLHYRTAHYCARKYETIGLPLYSPSRKRNRKIPVQVVRRQHALAYGKLVKIQSQVCSLYPGSQTIRPSEYCTTIQCGHCSEMRTDIKGDKVYTCNECQYTMPRDVHGSRNIALKTLVGDKNWVG